MRLKRRDELARRTGQQGPKVPEAKDWDDWVLGFVKVSLEAGDLDPAEVTELAATTKLWPRSADRKTSFSTSRESDDQSTALRWV